MPTTSPTRSSRRRLQHRPLRHRIAAAGAVLGAVLGVAASCVPPPPAVVTPPKPPQHTVVNVPPTTKPPAPPPLPTTPPITVADIAFTGTCAQPGELGIWTFMFTLYLSNSTTVDRVVTVDARAEDKIGTIKTDQQYGALPSWINWQASATSCSAQSDGPPRPG